MNRQTTVLKYSHIFGMKNYQQLKEAKMKDLNQSHTDAVRMKKFMMDDLEWDMPAMLVDTPAQELNVHTTIKRKLD